MKKLAFYSLSLSVGYSLSVLCSGCSLEESPSRPNILLILTDDQGWGDVAFHGNPHLSTPHLDLLAGQGVRFKHFYVDPVCAPTRAALLTGRYPFRSGAVGVSRGWENMTGAAVTVAEMLKGNGYATGCFGKWHNGRHYNQHPLRQGFDVFFGFRSGGVGNYFDPALEYGDQENIPTEGYIANVLTDSAIAFIDRHRETPFFCYLPFNTPHTPFQVPDRYFSKYKKMGLNDAVAAVYGMVENIDDNVGRLIGVMENLRLMENTLIIFLSDNGPAGGIGKRYNGALKGFKGSIDEGGVRVPAFFYWKGTFYPGTEIKTPAAHIDIFPTIAGLVDSAAITRLALDGINLLPLLKEQQRDTSDREIFVMKHIPPAARDVQKEGLQASLRTAQYRFIRRQAGAEVFDIRNDPGQQQNIIEKEGSLTRQLAGALQNYLSQIPACSLERPSCPIGQSGAHRHTLYADEAFPGEGVTYFKQFGFNSDWMTDFDEINEKIWWKLAPEGTGTYRVYLRYTSSGGPVKLQIRAAGHVLNASIDTKYDPDFNKVPDRVAAVGKSSLRKPWKDLYLGELLIEQTAEKLIVELVDLPQSASVDVRAVILEPK